jgi:hypothetical protein
MHTALIAATMSNFLPKRPLGVLTAYIVNALVSIATRLWCGTTLVEADEVLSGVNAEVVKINSCTSGACTF